MSQYAAAHVSTARSVACCRMPCDIAACDALQVRCRLQCGNHTNTQTLTTRTHSMRAPHHPHTNKAAVLSEADYARHFWQDT
jgi:hypothetical protein